MVRTAAPPSPPANRPATQRRQLLAIGLIVAAFLVFFPTKQLVAQRVRMRQLETRLVQLQESNRELEAEVERLKDPGELELLARERLGLVKPGEESYLFVPTPSPDPTPAPTVSERTNWARKAWDRLVALIRGRPSGPPEG